jgi:hypothetical protein
VPAGLGRRRRRRRRRRGGGGGGVKGRERGGGGAKWHDWLVEREDLRMAQTVAE